MRPLPKRTGVTSLTDAELLLLDFAALYRASFAFYLNEHFEIFTNGFSHGLDDETVVRTLNQWERKGWIASGL